MVIPQFDPVISGKDDQRHRLTTYWFQLVININVCSQLIFLFYIYSYMSKVMGFI